MFFEDFVEVEFVVKAEVEGVRFGVWSRGSLAGIVGPGGFFLPFGIGRRFLRRFPEALVECFGADSEVEGHVGCFVKFLGVLGGQCDGLGEEGVLCVWILGAGVLEFQEK